MSDTQPEQKGGHISIPKKSLLAVVITIMITLFIVGGVYVYNSYVKTDYLSTSATGGAITDEILSKIKSLENDSTNASNSLSALENLKIQVEEANSNLNKEKQSIISKYTFDTLASSLPTIRDTSIEESAFLTELSNRINNSLKDLKGPNGLYNRLSVPDRGYYYASQKISLIDEYLKQLSTAFYNSFRIPIELYYYNNISIEEARKQLGYYQTKSSFQSAVDKWAGSLQTTLTQLNEKLNEIKTIKQTHESKVKQLKLELKAISGLSRDKTIITFALPVFAFLIIILFAIPYIYKSITVTDDNNREVSIMHEIFSKGLLLKIFTVFLLTIAIILLALGDKISGETIGTLLGGISVYILQNSFGKTENAANTTAEDPTKPKT